MTLEITVSGIDGGTNVIMYSSDIAAIRQFLTLYDHEGAALTLRLTTEDEGVYAVLAALASPPVE